VTIFDVGDFQQKFEIPRLRKPGFLSHDEMKFRINFLKEELNEFIQAYGKADLEEALDALIDLEYVLLGTAILMGFAGPPPLGAKTKRGTIWNAAWERVHKANMKKVKVTKIEDSKRESLLDIIKPEGWKPPQFKDLLQ
jgi:predicted HAD superfamily Cof-like phosphohydrolase